MTLQYGNTTNNSGLLVTLLTERIAAVPFTANLENGGLRRRNGMARNMVNPSQSAQTLGHWLSVPVPALNRETCRWLS
jgi:hypothetical protein